MAQDGAVVAHPDDTLARQRHLVDVILIRKDTESVCDEAVATLALLANDVESQVDSRFRASY